MPINVGEVQLRKEKQLFAALSQDSGVQKSVARIKELSSGWGFDHRRNLLTGALRLTRSMAPEVGSALARCREVTGYDRPIELYVKPDPMLNACCMKNPSGPALIVLSSRMLEVFTIPELQFVIGHEIGHAVYDHFSIPMPITAKLEELGVPYVSRRVSLDLFVWCRAAELSADRIGLLCCQNAEAAATGFFKLASGLASANVRADLAEYAKQVESLASAPQARAEPHDDDDTLDCFSTHPYSPVRVRAILAYAHSAAFQALAGAAGRGTIADADVDAIIDRDLQLMEPSYLEEKTKHADIMKRLLYSAGLSVAAAHGEIEEREAHALGALLGSDYPVRPTDVTTARKDLDGRIAEAVKECNYADRCRLVQHLCIVAAADGQVQDAEVAEMYRIAAALGVPAQVVAQTISGAASPMD
jgi:uncharacterized tellurite resistance protein B-like protein